MKPNAQSQENGKILCKLDLDIPVPFDEVVRQADHKQTLVSGNPSSSSLPSGWDGGRAMFKNHPPSSLR
jgi:hypothetical protein